MAQPTSISEAASLALHTMAMLARDTERRRTNQEIAEVLGASGHHLAKVMQRLAKVGLVESIRGPQGGFRLAKPAGQITLLTVYEAIEGPVGEADCLLNEPICRGKDCILGEIMHSIQRQFLGYLKKTTLAELARSLRASASP